MNIFLSGKMDAKNGAWRDEILSTYTDYETGRVRPRWEITRVLDAGGYDFDDFRPIEFHRVPNTWALGMHNYVGPYRLTFAPEPMAKHCGYFHGSTVRGQHGMPDYGDDNDFIVSECLAAIRRADMVFAYINTPDAFGTLSEIGYAHALGKFVYVAHHADAEWEYEDYWFVRRMADAVGAFGRTTAQEEAFQYQKVAALFRDALVQWTARQPRPELYVMDSSAEQLARLAASSFNQIARWTSDPRVRSEAERMVRRLQAG